MVNMIWVIMLVTGIVYAFFNGTIEEVNEAIFERAGEAVTLSIGLISVLVFWLGIMKIAEEAGILKGLAMLFRPIILKIFPDIPKDHPAIGYILSNITANLFGLGNAATPMGIKAMKELKTLAPDEEATRSMITFLAINTAGLTIVPTTIIAIRMQYDSIAPTEIIGTTLVATTVSLCGALIVDRIFYYLDRRKEKL